MESTICDIGLADHRKVMDIFCRDFIGGSGLYPSRDVHQCSNNAVQALASRAFSVRLSGSLPGQI